LTALNPQQPADAKAKPMSNAAQRDRILPKAHSDLSSLRDILDQLPLGVFQTSPDGKIEYANSFLSRLLEAYDGEGTQKSESLRHRICQQARNCILSQGPLTGRLARSWNPDLFLRVFPIKDERRNPEGVVGLVEDISSMVRSRSKLEKKINELSILCELSKVLGSTLKLEEILRIVLIAVTAGQGLGFNRAFLLLVDDEGRVLEGKMAIGPSSPEEAKRIWDSLSDKEQSLEEVLHSYRSALKGKDVAVNAIVRKLKIPMSMEGNPLVRSMLNRKASVLLREQTGGEGLFHILKTDRLAVAPLMSKDKTLGVVAADNSITQKPIEDDDVKLLSICAHHASVAIETSRLYRELEEKVNKLAEANIRIAESSRRLLRVERLSVLGQVTSQLAHELRNPMTIIGGFARSILKKADKDDPQSEYLRIVVKETERMEKVLDNVLNFSKPDAANLEMVDLNQLVNQTFEMMEPEIDAGKVSIALSPSQELPLTAVNPDLIRQALLNIFRNAVRAMPNGGILSVATRGTEVSARIEVKDTGFGISPQHMGKIFDAFFTTDSEACGLGLTIASEIIKNHGGDIGVQSMEGKGTTFYIELPVRNGETIGRREAGKDEL
jgi:signal transduction histidine kinase